MNPTLTRPHVKSSAVASGEGERIWIVGDTMTFKATGESTGGSLLLFENLTSPGGGPPPHIHTREDEFFYVLDGTFEIRIGDEVHARRARRIRLRAPGHRPQLPQHGGDPQPDPRGLHPRRHGGLLPRVGAPRDRRRAGAAAWTRTRSPARWRPRRSTGSRRSPSTIRNARTLGEGRCLSPRAALVNSARKPLHTLVV